MPVLHGSPKKGAAAMGGDKRKRGVGGGETEAHNSCQKRGMAFRREKGFPKMQHVIFGEPYNGYHACAYIYIYIYYIYIYIGC